MKKKLIAKISALAILIVFFTACSKKVEYTNAIPADASFVVSIDLKSLIDKTGIDNKENESVRPKNSRIFEERT